MFFVYFSRPNNTNRKSLEWIKVNICFTVSFNFHTKMCNCELKTNLSYAIMPQCQNCHLIEVFEKSLERLTCIHYNI